MTQPDPTGRENNPYAYAGGDPVNQMDPTGADSACTKSGAQSILGIVVATGVFTFVAASTAGVGVAAGAGLAGAYLTATGNTIISCA